MALSRFVRTFAFAIGLTATVAASGCGSGPAPRETAISTERAQAAASTLSPQEASPDSTSLGSPSASQAGQRPRIVILGDSLTAGLGLSPAQAFPTVLQQKLDAHGLQFEIVNAGVSGDTSAGGLSRLDWALEGDVRVLVVALGGNDALRGLNVDELGRNLSAIIERARSRKINVAIAGMEAPPNYGQAYAVAFHEVYPALVSKYHVAFVPFLLQGVAGIESLNQRDGIHPTAEGARLVADNVWTVLRPMLTPR